MHAAACYSAVIWMTAEPIERTQVLHLPCAICGALVDPLRAPFVAHIDGAFRYYCSRECHARRLSSVAPPVRVTALAAPSEEPRAEPTPSIEEVADMLGLARASLPDTVREAVQAPPGDVLASDSVPSVSRPALPTDDRGVAVPAAALGCALAALALRVPGLLPEGARVSLLAVLSLSALGLAMRAAWRVRRTGTSALAFATGLLGPMVLLVLAAASRGPADVHLVDAAVLAASLPLVAWIVNARMARAARRLLALASDLPRVARVVRAGGDESVESSSVRAGEEVIVREGEIAPVDGVVRAGEALALPYAGSAEARLHAAGDSVLAGARVLRGELLVLATRAGDDVALARLPRAVGASAEAPRSLRLAERAAQALPFAACALGAGGALAHALDGGREPLGVAALAFGAVPAALASVLARVPFVDALARAAARGIVFRDASSVEAAATVGMVVFCVRGTVSIGKFEVVEVVSLGARSESELIALAAAAEKAAPEHPMAHAFAEIAARRGVVHETVRRPTLLPGRGITAITAGGESIALGSRQLLLAEGVSVAPAEDVARAIEGQRRIAVFIAIAGRVEGVFGLEDPLRDDARPAVQAMMDAGFDVALLSGESAGTSEAVGLALDVTHVRAEVLPEERAAAVRAIAEVANAVAVVGSPKRDGAALGAADVAVSLAAAGAAGADTAVALASDDLRDAAAAFLFAREARVRARRVAFVAFAGALLVAAACAFAPSLGAPGALAGSLAVSLAARIASRE